MMIKSQTSTLNMTWMKAAVLGCLWASSEIILGSFLHNVRLPFAGIILSGIGMILLIAVGQHWKETGLFWRAALICALMKSVSPSAVIFGPMIGIFMEGLLLDLSVTMLGRNAAGYVLGSIMAVSWVFVQRAVNYVIVYGFDIVELYRSLVFFAEKQMLFRFQNVWMPLLILWGIYMVTGFLVALAGIWIGRKMDMSKPLPLNLDQKEVLHMKSHESGTQFQFSLPWLFCSMFLLIVFLIMMNFFHPVFWISLGLILIMIWTLKYRSVLQQLKKPKFWITFMLITMLSALLFSRFPTAGMSVTDGLMAGLEMNFRAVLMIMGFTVAGKELSNPVIRNYLSSKWFRQTTLALEVAFETLPFVISNTPKVKEILRKPVSSIGRLAVQADFWLTRLQVTLKKKPDVILITGSSGEGKTTLMMALAKKIREADLRIAGIVSPAVYENNIHQGYDLINLRDQSRFRLSTTKESADMMQVGRFFFYPESLKSGYDALTFDPSDAPDIIMMEEIGAWELRGQGWAPALNRLIMEHDIPVILAVSDKLADKVTDAWQFQQPLIIRAKDSTPEMAFLKLMNFLTGN